MASKKAVAKKAVSKKAVSKKAPKKILTVAPKKILTVAPKKPEVKVDWRGLVVVNKLFPGRPDYVGPRLGMFGMLHHRKLFEYSGDVMERVEYVQKYKLKFERPIRLHNMIYLGEILDVDTAKIKNEKTRAKVLKYIRKHIPDCAWDTHEGGLDFHTGRE